MKLLLPLVIALLNSGASAEMTQVPGFRQPSQIRAPDSQYLVDYVVAPKPTRTISEAIEFCTTMGRVLPSPAEAGPIFLSTIEKKVTKLRDYDGSGSNGSFWTSEKSVLGCNAVLEVDKSGAKFSFLTHCSRRFRALAVCVPNKTPISEPSSADRP